MTDQNRRKNAAESSPLTKRGLFILGALCIASLVGHLILLPYMPEQIPTHFSITGEVNGWTDKIAIIPLDALPLLLLATFYIAPKIDPKGSAYRNMDRFYLALTTILILIAISATWLSELSVFGLMPRDNTVGIVVCLAIGAMLIMLGNYMPKVKRNYTLGCKTPWTLDNEQNWRLTHRFAGTTLVVVGTITMACGPLSGVLGDLTVHIMLGSIIVGTLAIFVYSYLVYRNGNAPLRSR